MRKWYVVGGLSFGLTALALLCAGWALSPAEKDLVSDSAQFVLTPDDVSYIADNLRAGDLVFRGRDGGWGNLGSMVSDIDRRYGHVGVAAMGDNGGWQVIHAAGDPMAENGRVQSEGLWSFLSKSERAGVYRLPLEGVDRDVFLHNLGEHVRMATPFDRYYDLTSDESLYCTELVWVTWQSAGAPDEALDTTAWRGKAVIALDDLQYAEGVERVAEVGSDSGVVKALAAAGAIR